MKFSFLVAVSLSETKNKKYWRVYSYCFTTLLTKRRMKHLFLATETHLTIAVRCKTLQKKINWRKHDWQISDKVKILRNSIAWKTIFENKFIKEFHLCVSIVFCIKKNTWNVHYFALITKNVQKKIFFKILIDVLPSDIFYINTRSCNIVRLYILEDGELNWSFSIAEIIQQWFFILSLST